MHPGRSWVRRSLHARPLGEPQVRFCEELEFRASGFQVLGSRVLGFSGLGVQDF